MNNKKIVFGILLALTISTLLISFSASFPDGKTSEEADFERFKELIKEEHGIEVTQEDYENLRQAYLELDKDCETYGPLEPKVQIAYCDHVFIGKILKHHGNFQTDYSGTGYQIPYNRYNVEIVDLIKGPALKNEIVLNQSGGYYTEKSLKEEIGERNVSMEVYPKDENGYYGFLSPGDGILKEGEYYLFITTTQDDGYCTIFHPEYRILLENYEEKGGDAFEEVLVYKNLVESGVKDYYRLRMIANEEIEKRAVLG